MVAARKTIWVDLENTPHIPFFAPIIRHLESRGYKVVLTARDAYQTCEMADLYALSYRRIGRHFGRNVILKAIGLATRTLQLIPFALHHRPVLAVSHASRSQVVTSQLLHIPTVMLEDYEFSKGVGFGHPTWMLMPEALSNSTVSQNDQVKVRYYSGIKEDVYVADFRPDANILTQLGLSNSDIIITVRPPASEAHYHNFESDLLFQYAMERFYRTPGVQVVLLPRNKRQEQEIRTTYPSWFSGMKVVVPPDVVDGLNLLWHSDLVVSGGGTMNREAAALGLPVYSIFRGRIGAVDRHLHTAGRLTLIESTEDVDRKILLQHRTKLKEAKFAPRKALSEIVGHIDNILACPSC
jgi:predicted glycosyltransferase